MNAGTTAEAGGMHVHEYMMSSQSGNQTCSICGCHMHQPTPAYCHGNENIVGDVWFEDSD